MSVNVLDTLTEGLKNDKKKVILISFQHLMLNK